jgi:hypothetical protein
MTFPLRRAHRYVWFALGPVLPGLLAAALVLRPYPAPEEQAADRITFRLPNGAEVVADARELWGKAVDAPDPLVYWSATANASPETARLLAPLGRARRAVLDLPGADGYLILYSLAHREVIASAPAPEEVP